MIEKLRESRGKSGRKNCAEASGETGVETRAGNKAARTPQSNVRPLPRSLYTRLLLIRCANFCRNFATFGATTNEQ
jgi:hypothetical protein